MFRYAPSEKFECLGDGGVIVTNSDELHKRLVITQSWLGQSRYLSGICLQLDALQAIVGKHLIKNIDHITQCRIDNATYFDRELGSIPEITIPPRNLNAKQVFHLYVIRAERRDELQRYLIDQGIDAKIHYPVPMHLQLRLSEYGYKDGDFPVAEAICKSVISLPVHEFITPEQQAFVVEKVKQFYR